MIKDKIGDKAIRICDTCGDEKLVSYWNLLKKEKHECYSCSNKKTNLGKTPYNKGRRQEPKNIGNTYEHSDNYTMVWVGKTNVPCGYMPLHRLLVADDIGRQLTKDEKVHHINGVKSDNNLDNLLLCKNMSEHRLVHAQLETLSFELVKAGVIKFNREMNKYELSRPIGELIGEKSRELLETPVKDNQQPSSEELAEKVQRLFRKEVGSSDPKCETSRTDDDIVCSIQ